jgi:hypothetical protein
LHLSFAGEMQILNRIPLVSACTYWIGKVDRKCVLCDGKILPFSILKCNIWSPLQTFLGLPIGVMWRFT